MEHAAIALGGDAGVEEHDVEVSRLRLDARVDEVLERLDIVGVGVDVAVVGDIRRKKMKNISSRSLAHQNSLIA